MDWNLTSAIIKTSWLTALFCFLMSGGLMYFYYKGWKYKITIVRACAWAFYGFCFIGTQFGADWFIVNQRAFFRIATNTILGAELFALYTAYLFLKPIIEASANNGK